jgi:hypothetical protein
MAGWVTLLGFAAEAQGAALLAAMRAVPGPAVSVTRAGGLACLAQADAARFSFGLGGRAAALQRLRTVQMRLEAACVLGPFLPADPAHARCARGAVAGLLAAAAAGIAEALAGPGTRHQWDVVLRWQGDAVVAARRAEIAAAADAAGGGRTALAEAVEAALARERLQREAALRAAVAPVAVAVAAAGAGATETGLTVLLPADGGEAALEAALNALPDGVTANGTIDMRGPLPPVSFAAVRIDRAAPAEVAQAWRTLALPERVDAAGLRRHWRDCAARMHPDRAGGEDVAMASAGAAFRLLRDLLPAGDGALAWSLPALQRHAACRMSVRTPMEWAP